MTGRIQIEGYLSAEALRERYRGADGSVLWGSPEPPAGWVDTPVTLRPNEQGERHRGQSPLHCAHTSKAKAQAPRAKPAISAELESKSVLSGEVLVSGLFLFDIL